MAYIPEIPEQEILGYLRQRNPVLGWGPRLDDRGRAIDLAPRPDSSATPGKPPCISAYGDSFTYGYGVTDQATYPHFLGEMMGCAVANYGVDGYGSDQALMLVRAQQHLDTTPVIILGHLSENILRNVNRYRNLLYAGSPLQFKPRFVLESDSLQYLPIPVNSVADFRALERDPDSVLSGDALLVRPRRKFPFSVALARWLTQDFKLRARIAGVPSEAAYYTRKHPAGGLELTSRVLSTFARGMAEREKQGVVLLIPTAQALTYAATTGIWVDQPLAEALHRERIPVIHAGPKILQRLAGTDPCSLFEGCKESHFGIEGNKVLAEVVASELRRMNMLPVQPSPAVSQELRSRGQY